MASNKSFSLIEVLIFVTILVLFFVAAITVTTYSLRNMKINEHKVIATHFAEEGLEWVKSEKESDWQSFVNRDPSSGSGTKYCLNSGLSWNNSGACSDYTLGLPPFFKREVTLTNSGVPVSQTNVVVEVRWIEGNQTLSTKVNSVVNLWE